MPVLLLQLAGPLQSWGDSSRFVNRNTRQEPTKSGIVGLLAAAQGRSREENIADLAQLRLGVRVDQAGRLTRDFQTEVDWRTGKSKPLTYRYYLADAKFLIVLEGDKDLLSGLAEALRSPKYPLYLGRRSCVPSRPLVVGIQDEKMESVLLEHPWLAAKWYRKKQPEEVQLAYSRDAQLGEPADEMIRDVPVSFKQHARKHELLPVIHGFTPLMKNSDGEKTDHQPFSLLGGA